MADKPAYWPIGRLNLHSRALYAGGRIGGITAQACGEAGPVGAPCWRWPGISEEEGFECQRH